MRRVDWWYWAKIAAFFLAVFAVLAFLVHTRPAWAQTPEPAIVTNVSIQWDGDRLLLDWQGRGYVCARIVGGGRLPTYLENGCAYDEARLVLPTTGVSADYAPQLREAIELRDGNGVIVNVPIPPRAVLPIVLAPGAPAAQLIVGPPIVSAAWHGRPLRVFWIGQGCLYLAGGGQPPIIVEHAGHNLCGESGTADLETIGVSLLQAPHRRDQVLLMAPNESGLLVVIAGADIPPRIGLPWIVRP